MSKTQSLPLKWPLRTRDRFFITSSLAVVVALAWGYLYVLATNMPAMSKMDVAMSAGIRPWSLAESFLMFAMWVVMMVGMMVPTAMRAVLIYAGISHRAHAQGTPVAPTYWFVTGYAVVWSGFGLAATLFQAGFDRLGLLSPLMVSSSPLLGAGLLIAAGAYQLTPWKDVCLQHCQSPAMYLATRFRPGVGNAFALGMRHGTYCLGCCWLLMGLLFLGGVMNLLWIAAITGFVLLEKLLPASLRVARLSGWLMMFTGVLYLSNV